MKKSLILAAALVCFFINEASATNRVEVKVTSAPIEYHVLCDKANGFTLEFDSGTTLEHLDIITIDLDFAVTLCRLVDLEISPGGNGACWNGATAVFHNTGSRDGRPPSGC